MLSIIVRTATTTIPIIERCCHTRVCVRHWTGTGNGYTGTVGYAPMLLPGHDGHDGYVRTNLTVYVKYDG